MEYSQIKPPFALLQTSSSTHLNVHSSHLNGRLLLLWVSLCEAKEVLRVQHVLALFTLEWMFAGVGRFEFDMNYVFRKLDQGHGVQFRIMSFDKCTKAYIYSNYVRFSLMYEVCIKRSHSYDNVDKFA